MSVYLLRTLDLQELLNVSEMVQILDAQGEQGNQQGIEIQGVLKSLVPGLQTHYKVGFGQFMLWPSR